MYTAKSTRKGLYWFLFFILMLVAPALACDENDVRDGASEVYYTAPISAQCSDINIYGKTDGQCK